MNIVQILDDWNNGLTHGQIKEKHNLSDEQEYAITNCSNGLTIEQIYKRVQLVKPEHTKSMDIEKIMKPTNLKILRKWLKIAF